MPNTHSTLTSLFADIADSIRAKTGDTEDIIADDFPTAINAIPSGGGATEPYIEETYDESGKNLIHAVMHGYTGIRKYLFDECTTLASIELPDEITVIGNYAFASCGALTIQSLPSNLTSIGCYSFRGCNGLLELEIPSGIKSLGIEAFSKCQNLTSVKFLSKPTGLVETTVFLSCTQLTNIYVPWAQGAVSGAPWGATNATIHYNSVV